MKELTLRIPENLELSERETKRFLAAKMHEVGKLTLGKAADLAGLSKTTFAELLADYDVSLVNYSPSEVISDAARL